MVVANVWAGNTVYVFLVVLLSSIIQFYVGHSYYISAFKSVKHKSANMDVLIVLGTTSAWLYGILLIFRGFPSEMYNFRSKMMKHNYHMMIHSNVHNFETSAVLILIVTLGRYIKSYSKMKTIGKLSELASM